MQHRLISVALLGCALGFGWPPAALADAGHTLFSAGVPGNPKRPARVVEVIMKEGDGKMEYVPNRVEVKRNEQIRFVLKNVGELAHEFVLATTADNLKHAALMQKYPDMEHDDPNGKTLQPKANSEILWRFNKRGTFEFGCLIPGHREAGMTGIVIVK
jgi:uncharacterized cupredoxin-like copper-binding protein